MPPGPRWTHLHRSLAGRRRKRERNQCHSGLHPGRLTGNGRGHEQARRPLPCRTFEAVPVGEKVSYRIPLVPNVRRLRSGHKLRFYLTTDDQNVDRPALLEFLCRACRLPLLSGHTGVTTASIAVQVIESKSVWQSDL